MKLANIVLSMMLLLLVSTMPIIVANMKPNKLNVHAYDILIRTTTGDNYDASITVSSVNIPRIYSDNPGTWVIAVYYGADQKTSKDAPTGSDSLDELVIPYYQNGEIDHYIYLNPDAYYINRLYEGVSCTNAWVKVLVYRDGYNSEEFGVPQPQQITGMLRISTPRIIEIIGPNIRVVKDYPEQNMGDPNTLEAFLEFVFNNYHADYYCVVISDHGSNWKGAVYDDTSNEDHLTLNEIRNALAAATNVLGRTIDILIFDACLMGSIEVAYAVAPYVNYIIFSEEYLAVDGYSYPLYSVCNELNHRLLSPVEFIDEFITAFSSFYSNLRSYYELNGSIKYLPNPKDQEYLRDDLETVIGNATISAVNASLIDKLKNKVDQLAGNLSSLICCYANEIKIARSSTEEFAKGIRGHENTIVDLYDLVYHLKQEISDSEIRSIALEIMDIISDMIIAEWHNSGHPNAHGITIYFPEKENLYSSSYESILFAQHTSWDEFLKNYYSFQDPPDVQILPY